MPSQPSRIPPYVSYRTHQQAIKILQDRGVPTLIDGDGFDDAISGENLSQLLRAWRYLELVDADNRPSPRLHQFVNSIGNERQHLLGEILRDAYPFLLNEQAQDFDLATVSADELAERFIQSTGASLYTARRCIAFFASVAQEAGIEMSEDVEGGRRVYQSMQDGSKRTRTARQISAAPSSTELIPSESRAQTSTQLLIGKLPDFNPEWDAEIQKIWFEMFSRIWSLIEDAKEPG